MEENGGSIFSSITLARRSTMKKKKVLLITLLCVAILGITIGGIAIWFNSQGVHTLFNYTHVDLSCEAFLVSSNDQSTVPVTFQAEGIAKAANESGISAKQDVCSVHVDGLPGITRDNLAIVATSTKYHDILEIMFYADVSADTSDDYHYVLLYDTKASTPLLCTFVEDENGEQKETHILFDKNDSVVEILRRAYIK